MKKHVIVLSVLYFITLSFAQAPDTLWTRTFGIKEQQIKPVKIR